MTRLFAKAVLLALLVQAGSIVSSPGQPGRPIQFSEPHTDKVNTNLNRLGQGLSRLDRLESELSRPFDFVTPGDSMQGGFLTAPLPTPPPAVNNPRVKELIDRKRDLPFMTQEEIFRIHSPEDQFRVKAPELTADGRDRATLRPVERALLPREGDPDASRSFNLPGGESDTPNNRFREVNDNSNPRGISDLDRNLRNLTGSGSFFDNNRTSDRRAADFFGLGENTTPKMIRRTDSELQRIEQFKQLYDFSSGSEGMAAAGKSPFSNPYLESSFYDPTPQVTAPAANLGTPAGSSFSYGLAAPSFTPPPPAPAPVQTLTPAPSPFLTVPKRGF